MFKPFRQISIVTVLLITLVAASADRSIQNPSVEPLHHPAVPIEQLNQCAGTVQHYTLPPTGYKASTPSRESDKGKALYRSYQCAACHMIDGKGGKLGPPLDGIGGHRGKEFIVAHLLNPEEQMRDYPEVFGGRPNIMPHLGVSRREAKQLAEYLLTLTEPGSGFLVTAHPKLDPPPPKDPKHPIHPGAGADQIARGKQIFIDNNCAMCHTVQGSATRFGPRLDNLSIKWTREALISFLIEDDQKAAMKSKTLGLSENEVNSLVDFLMSLKPSPEAK
jgi:mono/diheme cytochrome c family protein